MQKIPRHILVSNIADSIISRLENKVFRLAIDGIDGAGKSVFGDELAADLKSKNIPVIRSSSDYFHNPRSVRYRLGKQSPEGYFADSFNYDKMKSLLLDPISEGGKQLYCEQYFNHRTDQVEQSALKKIEGTAVLVMDGIFLHRPTLIDYWDYSLFLKVSRGESLRRCFVRDGSGSADIESPENRRYVVGQQLYLSRCQPMVAANLVINNEDFNAPFVEE